MGGHDHHHAPYTVPKASIYKVEDAPQLLEAREALARRGLKDPWLRNEVWRYNVKTFGTHRSRFMTFMFRGLPLGAALAAATIAAEFALGKPFFTGPVHDHGHGHGHDEHHH